MLNKLDTKGFTLLELLIVVLIIGILAAIALPKYQLAVEKTRATERLAMATTIASAQERYHLGSGHWANTINELDLTMPSTRNDAKNLELIVKNAHQQVEVKHVFTNNDATFYKILVQLESIGYIPFKKGAVTCSIMGPNRTDMARKVCDSLCGAGTAYQAVLGEQGCLISHISTDPS